jgi:hypothetical protein
MRNTEEGSEIMKDTKCSKNDDDLDEQRKKLRTPGYVSLQKECAKQFKNALRSADPQGVENPEHFGLEDWEDWDYIDWLGAMQYYIGITNAISKIVYALRPDM